MHPAETAGFYFTLVFKTTANFGSLINLIWAWTWMIVRLCALALWVGGCMHGWMHGWMDEKWVSTVNDSLMPTRELEFADFAFLLVWIFFPVLPRTVSTNLISAMSVIPWSWSTSFPSLAILSTIGDMISYGLCDIVLIISNSWKNKSIRSL